MSMAMRKIAGGRVGRDGVTDAFGAESAVESREFFAEVIALFRKHGMALVPQNEDYEADFHEPMRVVPMDEEIEKEIRNSWVAFEEGA